MAPEPLWNVDKYYYCNLIESDAIRIILSVERPDAIVHLAAVSSVAQSWKAPVNSFLN
ncbi:MAG: GDP-mannose 4,6-dehydratase, partial [Fibrobacter sp.]|nr:GDP-mannose 4,6-dehydratase [Fibrobacter sp.]